MKWVVLAPAALLAAGSVVAYAQDGGPVTPAAPAPTVVLPGAAPAAARPAAGVVLPADTVIQVTAVSEISSKGMHVGDVEMLQVATDVAQDGVIVIPRGSPVKATVTWRTGKGIVGKSAKFELTFTSVSIRGKDYALKGKHRQEGRGNTVAALLGSTIITGHSAVIASGQALTAFTAVPIPAV